MTTKLTKSAALSPTASSRLLWAASFLDAIFILFAMQILQPIMGASLNLVAPQIGSATMQLDPVLRGAIDAIIVVVSFAVLLIIYWLITELVLGGRTLGRLCLMLEIRNRDGSAPTVAQLTMRGMRKLATLGFSGLRLSGLDSHDAKSGLIWASPLAAGHLSATRNWRIQILSGHFQGTSHVVDRLPGYDQTRVIKVGRDPAWSNLTLDTEERVSGQHALIRSGARGWEIKDYGGGRGSSNKTFLNGRPISPGVWQVFGKNDTIAVANVKIRLVPS